MLTFGEEIDISDLAPVKLVHLSPTARNYAYLHPIAQAVLTEIELPVYLVDDGENHTSDLFIDEAIDIFTETDSFENSVLSKLIQRLALQNNAILIWYANNDLLAYQYAKKCTSIDNLFELASEQAKSYSPIEVYLAPNLSFKRDALRP